MSSSTRQNKNNNKDHDWSGARVILDPFAPRTIPNYTYTMPSSSQSEDSDDDNVQRSHSKAPAKRTEEYYSIDTYREPNYQQSYDYKQESFGSREMKRSSTNDTHENDSKYDSKRQKVESKIDSKSKYESKPLESKYNNTKIEQKREISKSQLSKLAIPIEIINDTKQCIYGLERSIKYDRRYPKTASNLVWNAKVLKFLEENLEAAKKTNNQLARQKK